MNYLEHLILITLNRIKGRKFLKGVGNGLYTSSSKPVPYISQFAQVTKEKDIEKIDVESEVFQIQGYPTKKDFDFWNRRVCGIACLKMVFDSQEKPNNKTMWELINEGLEIKGYKFYDDKGKFVDIGWYHESLLQLAKKYGLRGYLRQYLSIYNVAREIVSGNYIIASVKVPQRINLEDDGTYFKKDYKGETTGHLILLTAVEIQNGIPKYFLANNPTGIENYGKDSKIDSETFVRIFNGRTIVLKAN